MQNCNINEVHSRSILAILQDSLEDRPQQDITENEVRYKLIIDPSEDDSLTRLLFAFGVLRRDNTRMFVCSDFPGDSQLQKVCVCLSVCLCVCVCTTVAVLLPAQQITELILILTLSSPR